MAPVPVKPVLSDLFWNMDEIVCNPGPPDVKRRFHTAALIELGCEVLGITVQSRSSVFGFCAAGGSQRLD